MQSLSRQGEVNALVENYGHVIVDDNFAGSEIGRTLVRPQGARHVRRASMPPCRRGVVRRHSETRQGEIRARPHRHADPSRRSATDHLDAISAALDGRIPGLFILHGRMSRKQRAALIEQLDALPSDAPRVLLATGKLVGEGFDHPPLDTLVLAMPVSWKGTLQQYAGRLHREHTNKTDVRIVDFVDTGRPALLRMWDKRRRGYKAMGYRIDE